MEKKKYLAFAQKLITISRDLNGEFRAFLEDAEESGDDHELTKWLGYKLDAVLEALNYASSEASHIYTVKSLEEEKK